MNKYLIIDKNKQEVSYCYDSIEQGFKLDMLLDYYERYELPYQINYYNNNKIIVIK